MLHAKIPSIKTNKAKGVPCQPKAEKYLAVLYPRATEIKSPALFRELSPR